MVGKIDDEKQPDCTMFFLFTTSVCQRGAERSRDGAVVRALAITPGQIPIRPV